MAVLFQPYTILASAALILEGWNTTNFSPAAMAWLLLADTQ